MRFIRSRFILALCASVATLTVPFHGFAQHEHDSAVPAGANTQSTCYQRLSESMMRMHKAMAGVKPSRASSDENFVRMMLPHHQAALEMARVELECGSDPQTKRLAQEITADQQSEIELMRLWLKQHPGSSGK